MVEETQPAPVPEAEAETEDAAASANPKKRKSTASAKKANESLNRPFPDVFFCHKAYVMQPVHRFQDLPDSELNPETFVGVTSGDSDGSHVTLKCKACVFQSGFNCLRSGKAEVIGNEIGKSSSGLPVYESITVRGVTYRVRGLVVASAAVAPPAH